MKRNGKRNAGFTLIEVMFAGFTFAVAALGLVSAMVQGGRMTDTARDELGARMAMRSVVADILASPFDSITALQGTGFAVADLAPTKDDKDGMPGEIILEAGPDKTKDIHRVRLRVRWRSRAGDRMIETVHYVANVRGTTDLDVRKDAVTSASESGELSTLEEYVSYLNEQYGS
ncbi:MAG: prepilin-type N-terminal cleavage/methylation domain-containing protein [Planctomycetota bacterium]|nr:prepilin-type N-terminal cleavage/methylation domain-containing protein [Planctomycetota bacterium]